MKILFITNFFPPHYLGGFEMLCYDVVKLLQQRGHRIKVLASDFRTANMDSEEFDVARVLKLESDIDYYSPSNVFHYWPDRRLNDSHVQQAIHNFAPDVVFVWGMWNLPKAVAETAERLAGSRVVYYFADAWPSRPGAHRAYWDASDGGQRGRLLKSATRPLARRWLWPEWQPYRLHFQHALCCSISTRDEIRAAGFALENAMVIYEGIDLAPFLEVASARGSGFRNAQRPRIAYVGRLVTHKGVHTAIEAVKWLMDHPAMAVYPNLTILGEGHPDYTAHLHDLVKTHGLEQEVEFVSPIPRQELPRFLAEFDILVLPSIYEEPLALIMQNALAAGLVVIATWTGGTKETIINGENGLVFQPEDAVGLAQQIVRVVRDPELQIRLQKEAIGTAKRSFDLARMTDQIEAYLLDVAKIAELRYHGAA